MTTTPEQYEKESNNFEQEAGKLALDSTLTHFVVEAYPEEIDIFQEILSTVQDITEAIPHFKEKLPRFIDLLNEEVTYLQHEFSLIN